MARTLTPAPAPARSAALARVLAFGVLLGTLAACAWAYRAGHDGAGYPYNSFLYRPSGRFKDLTSFFTALRGGDDFQLMTAPYPPFSYIAMEPFAWIGATAAPVLWAAVAVAGLGGFALRQLDVLPRAQRVAVTLVLTVATYPFLFAFDRLNIELVVTVLLAGFAYGLQTRRTIAAAVLIGVAIALKGYPAIFAAVFLVRGQWRALGYCALTAGACWILGTAFFAFDVARSVDVLRGNVASYNDVYALGNLGLPFGCSLWGALKLLAGNPLGGGTATMRTLLPLYQALCAVLLAGTVAALWRLPLKLWEQVALLTIAFVALPPVSADYKLLDLVVPMALFLREGGDDERRWWYLGGFALLMVPKAYLHFDAAGTNLGVLADPLIMLALAALIVATGLGRRRAAAAVTAGPAAVAGAVAAPVAEPGYSAA